MRSSGRRFTCTSGIMFECQRYQCLVGLHTHLLLADLTVIADYIVHDDSVWDGISSSRDPGLMLVDFSTRPLERGSSTLRLERDGLVSSVQTDFGSVDPELLGPAAHMIPNSANQNPMGPTSRSGSPIDFEMSGTEPLLRVLDDVANRHNPGRPDDNVSEGRRADPRTSRARDDSALGDSDPSRSPSNGFDSSPDHMRNMLQHTVDSQNSTNATSNEAELNEAMEMLEAEQWYKDLALEKRVDFMDGIAEKPGQVKQILRLKNRHDGADLMKVKFDKIWNEMVISTSVTSRTAPTTTNGD
jgi:hypothetical protein